MTVPSYGASIFLQEELLLEHFSNLIKFVKTHSGNFEICLKMCPFTFSLRNNISSLCELYQLKTQLLVQRKPGLVMSNHW
jgi:hypothetical protein